MSKNFILRKVKNVLCGERFYYEGRKYWMSDTIKTIYIYAYGYWQESGICWIPENYVVAVYQYFTQVNSK